MPDLPDLPVTEVLPALADALAAGGAAVLVAPPGAGKTTLVPLHLLDAPWRSEGLIVLLEPRRLAARAAARRMASLIGEEVGGTVGYRMRLDTKVSGRTRILVVTEGVFARMVLEEPELSGISVVLFDEFHERSLDADFGLALALDVRSGLRPDLRLLVMSATLDGARVARLLGDAPVIESEGRSFPVALRYRERAPGEPIEQAMANAIRESLASETGSILAFLPGQREIERTAERLQGRLTADAFVVPLYGALEAHGQDEAIRPAPEGRRKVVLATSVAESSITIDGVRVVIDSGLARLPRYEPSTGLTALETVRASRASVDQRAGRAGRTAPGVAIRLWRAEQTAALPTFAPPEILEADLSGLVLDCAAWGVLDPSRLSFLDPPPAPALSEARALLVRLHAIDEAGRITPDGEAMRALALPARLAHMGVAAARRAEAQAAAEAAVLLTERGLGGNDVDLDTRLSRFRAERGERAARARSLAARLASAAESAIGVDQSRQPGGSSTGRLLLDAWPDRVAKARGRPGQYVLANGRGGEIDPALPLSRASWLVVAELQGRAAAPRILAAAEVSEEDVLAVLGREIETRQVVEYDATSASLRARETRRLGAIRLSERALPPPSGDAANRAINDAVRRHGLGILPWGREAMALRSRLRWLRRGLGEPWPAMDDEALLEGLDDWLLPFLPGEPRMDGIPSKAIADGLMSLVPHDLQRRVDALAPTHFEAPTGSHVPIRYEGEAPVIAIRVQELFGLSRHPAIAGGTVPLLLELLSPAHRPIQVTRDLPGFWAGSWKDLRAEMRGRYPKHVWPDDPAATEPTRRAKPRG